MISAVCVHARNVCISPIVPSCIYSLCSVPPMQRPVYRCNTTGQKWVRIKSCVRYEKQDDAPPQLTFDHTTENSDDIIHFAFTYPYTYAMVQEDMKRIDELSTKTDMENPESIYCCRELATYSLDGRRIDLITITSALGADRENTREPPLEGLFPIVRVKDKGKKKRHTVSGSSKSVNLDEESGSENDRDREDNKEIEDIINLRPLVFPSKQIVFVSARVHPGEVKTVFSFVSWMNDFALLLIYLNSLRPKHFTVVFMLFFSTNNFLYFLIHLHP